MVISEKIIFLTFEGRQLFPQFMVGVGHRRAKMSAIRKILNLTILC